MKIKNEEEKNTLFIRDINSNNNSYTYKLFKYFYFLIHGKKQTNLFLKYILIFIETIQFISYAFSSNHYDSWKLGENNIKLLSNILSGFRLSFVVKLLEYKIFSIILYLLVIIIFILCLIVILNILFIESPSKLHKISISIIQKMIDIISVIFYIPITEIILIPIKCVDGKVYGFNDGEKCWENVHYLNIFLGILGTILLFIWCIFMLFFSFYPFQSIMSTTRVSSNNDIIMIIMKLFIILQYLLIQNEDISLAILLLISIAIFFSCYKESTYNNRKLEFTLNMRNILIFWTYFVLLIAKIFENVLANGFIYLLVFGCPIIIYLSIIIFKGKDIEGIIQGNIKNINDYIKKAKFNVQLINSFIERNNNVRNGNENEGQRDLILLRGNIQFHSTICTNKDCPLIKFMNNEGNYNTQKQCLLNYMNIFFNKGLKTYPNNFNLILLFMHFNYSKRFNLNSVRTYLLQLKKMDCNIKEKYIIYCIEENIKNNKGDGFDFSIENEKDNDSHVDLIEQKYQKLKYLIENSIKLYGEFWGIFSTNISSNINTGKLYSLGEKLNIYLNEMNNLWDNELKNKRIGNECQSIVQLYSKYLLEILWDQKKSKEVYKKLNDENINNYYQNDNKKIKEESNKGINIDEFVDNQDYLLFCDSDEKGNCKIIQSSASFAYLLSYQKIDIVGKALDIIFPNFLIEDCCKYLEESIISLHNGKHNQNDLSFQENDSNKNTKLIVVKSRMGYIFPLFASFTILDDNDYSDSFLVKTKLENKQSKSEYAYYVVTNTEFTIENISSSAINLRLFLDLLKKYVVKMDILVRTENDKNLNLYEKFNEYEEEPKEVTWVFPDIIYPKDNIQQKKDDEIEELIEKSYKKKFNLQIKPINFNGNENIGFIFKFTEISIKKNKKKINNINYIPKCNQNLIMFDLLNLRYFRTLLVENKSGLRNYRNPEYENEKINIENNKSELKKNTKKNKKSLAIEEEDDYSDNFEKNMILLTKEKILELQVYNYLEIKNFIFSLPLYGSDVVLERFRPNGDKYSASKITESLIKIQISHFCKRIDEKFKVEENKIKKKNKNIHDINNHIESPKSSNTNNYLFSSTISSSQELSKPNSTLQNEEMNKGLSSDSSSTLTNIFKANTINYIKILINFTFIGTFILILIEFLITFNHINKLKKKIEFLKNSYIILNNMLYTKHFVTEGVIALALNNLNKKYVSALNYENIYIFLDIIANQLSENRQEFTETYDTFTSNELCKEFKDFMETTKINIYTLTVNIEENLELIFNSGMTRISSSINDLVSNPLLMRMNNRNTYELMHNLINEYFINWQKVVTILFNDSIEATKLNIPLLIIVLGYFFISIVIIIVFLKLLSIFSLDREKPINLFLTLKKVVFENLKNSAENFSNQLLNKFFGNEDFEEESRQDYQSNIQPSDINIAKFKAANEYGSSIKKGFYFMKTLLIIIIFLLFNLIYFIIKYVDFRDRMNNVNQFILLYDKTNTAQIDLILSVDIFKSYLFNKSIPILNQKNTNKELLHTFLNSTEKFEESIIFITKTKSFLGGDYFQKYKEYFLGDFSELLDKNLITGSHYLVERYITRGLMPVETDIFEIIRYYTINYCNISKKCFEDYSDEISDILSENDNKLLKINFLNQAICRHWYAGVINLLVQTFHEYQNKNKLIYIIFFICLIVIVIIYYCIIWKMNEQKLNYLLKGSADLINLIPQEIKNIIIEKINE